MRVVSVVWYLGEVFAPTVLFVGCEGCCFLSLKSNIPIRIGCYDAQLVKQPPTGIRLTDCLNYLAWRISVNIEGSCELWLTVKDLSDTKYLELSNSGLYRNTILYTHLIPTNGRGLHVNYNYTLVITYNHVQHLTLKVAWPIVINTTAQLSLYVAFYWQKLKVYNSLLHPMCGLQSYTWHTVSYHMFPKQYNLITWGLLVIMNFW